MSSEAAEAEDCGSLSFVAPRTTPSAGGSRRVARGEVSRSFPWQFHTKRSFRYSDGQPTGLLLANCLPVIPCSLVRARVTHTAGGKPFATGKSVSLGAGEPTGNPNG